MSQFEHLLRKLLPKEKIQTPRQRLEAAGYKTEIISDALIMGKNPSLVPIEEINKIVGFVRPIDSRDLRGHCTQRTAESVFSGVAQYGWERPPFTENTGVIPMGLHMISGKTLEDKIYIAFDSVSREVILSGSETDASPLAQTIIFCGNSEDEIQDVFKKFYGGKFLKQEIPDTPYERTAAQRKKPID